MDLYTEEKVKEFSHDELVNALVSCATVYGRFGLGDGEAGTNTCLCQDEVRRRLQLVLKGA